MIRPAVAVSQEAHHAGRRRRADRRGARHRGRDRAVHRALRLEGASPRRVQGVRVQERDLADGHRPHRALAADRSGQGGRPLPRQARRRRLPRGLRVPGHPRQRRAPEEGRRARRRPAPGRGLGASARHARPLRRAPQARVVRVSMQTFRFELGELPPEAEALRAEVRDSLRTRAERVAGGYRVNGTKVWTSNAHLADYMIATFRTHHDPAKKHEGLTQFLVDTKLAGITMSPIIDLAGSHHFNMVVFEDVFVPEDMRVGEEGAGWKQVTTELAFERSGPERYLSSFALLLELVREVSKDPGERAAATVGRLVAHLATLRQMSLSVALMLEAGENPNLEAAVVKDVGTTFEQEGPEIVHALLGVEPTIDTGSDLQQVLGFLMQRAPSFSLRGGTREILRGIIARRLGPR